MPTKRTKKTVSKKLSTIRNAPHVAATHYSWVDRFKKFSSNPAVQMMASTVLNSALTNLASRMNTRYPNLAGLLRENFNLIETKLGSGSSKNSSSSDSADESEAA